MCFRFGCNFTHRLHLSPLIIGHSFCPHDIVIIQSEITALSHLGHDAVTHQTLSRPILDVDVTFLNLIFEAKALFCLKLMIIIAH